MNDIKIFDHKLGKNSKLAIIRVENSAGDYSSLEALNNAIFKYCEGTPFVLFIKDNLNPDERVIIKGIGDLHYELLSKFLFKRERKNKIIEINKINEKTIQH
jgi:hypothetical protein